MRLVALAGLILLVIESCEYENAEVNLISNCESISYKTKINPIILNRCAYSGCHISGFQPGNFSCYDSLKLKIDNGTFRLRVLEMKNMPPLSSLSSDDFNKIQCWFNSGAKNN